ncbi:MAG: glycosyltransferase family 2 protein [Spirochaetota bacterium]
MKEICIITITYNSKNYIGEAFRTLEIPCKSGIIEWIVVDNASQDATADYIKKEFPWITVIKSEENLGFGRGNNLGVRHTQAPFILFLNPDAVIDPEAVQCMLTFMKENLKAGITAPAIVEPEGTLQPWFLFPTPLRIFIQSIGLDRIFKQLFYIHPGSPPRKVDCVGGAVFMVRRNVFESLNGFDPKFFLYWEETDLCLRAVLGGWEIWTIGEAVARHTNAVSAKTHNKPMYAGCISEHFFQSRYYYLQKHYGKILAGITEVGELILLFCYSLLGRLINRSFKSKFRERLSGTVLQLPKNAR